MKTQTLNSIKKITIGLFTIMIIGISGCDNQQDKVNKDNSAEKTVKNIKPPNMDIHTAVFMGNVEVIKQHIAAGSDLNLKEEIGGSTALITASVFGKTDIALALIEAGADLNIKNNDGSTALHSAAFLCRLEIVEALLKHGCDKEILNNFGSTALISVSAPFENVKVIYDQFGKDLGPLGLKLDYDHIRNTRPKIAELLK